MSRESRAFTLIEILVAAVLVGIGIAAVMGSFGSLSQTQRRLIERETIERLAQSKLKELAGTREYESVTEGDFSAEGMGQYSWQAGTQESGVENLKHLSISVTLENSDLTAKAETLVFTPPAPTEDQEEEAA